MDQSLSDLPKILLPGFSSEQTFYRPISRELYIFTMFKIFGLSDFVFHLANLTFISLNGVLLLVFLKKMNYSAVNYGVSLQASSSANHSSPKPAARYSGSGTNLNNTTILISLIIYLLSAVHSLELYYLSSIQTLLSTFFALGSIISYLNYQQNLRKIFLIISVLFFVCALLSHESAAVLLGFYFLLEIFLKNWNIKKILLRLLPFLIIFLFRVLIHFYIGLPEQQVYRPSFMVQTIINTLMWFILWCFGLPEMMVDFMTLKFQVNPNFIRWYKDFYYIVFPAFYIVIGLLGIQLIKFRAVIFNSKFFLVVLFYLLSLSPFVFFPSHKFAYYLSFSVIWFSVILGVVFGTIWEASKVFKVLVTVSIILIGVISYQTTHLNKIAHWSAKRAQAAFDIISFIREKYPKPERETVFYIKNDPQYPEIAKEWGGSSKQASYILSGSDAMQVVYSDSTIRVYFEDDNNLPKSINFRNVISITPKFRY